ncbi:unnamed protein product [Candida parapsilosis]
MSFVAHEDHATHDFFSNNNNATTTTTNNNHNSNYEGNNSSGHNSDFHNIISSHNSHTKLLDDNQDILDEFLDQRVYDSMGTTTPSNNNNNGSDKNGSTAKIKQEPLTGDTLMNSLYALTNETSNMQQQHQHHQQESSNLANGNSFPQFSDLPNGDNDINDLDLSNLDAISHKTMGTCIWIYLMNQISHTIHFNQDRVFKTTTRIQSRTPLSLLLMP